MKVYKVNVLCLALFILLIAQSCMGFGGIRDFREYQTYWIQPIDDNSEHDVKWADYMYEHFKNRVTDARLVVPRNVKPDTKTVMKVRIGTDPSMSHEYSIDISRDQVTLKGRRRSSTIWIIYQFMAAAAEADGRISNDGLYPPILKMENTSGDFAFEYRGFYAPSNMDLDLMPIRASHNIDTDWGLWGHNLRKCFEGEIPLDAQALVDGMRTTDQLCFSSEKLYKAVEHYIAENYGEEPDLAAKFMIMPDDNDLVCMCPECRERGNTAYDASPAVTTLAKHLAHRFPYHEFFITNYLTTKAIPTYRLPENMGIMISAIDYPLTGRPDQMSGFESILNRCNEATDKVYIWEYGRNFDDYLTPFPCYSIMAERLKFYRDNGVKGIFINGSGYDYSTFTIMRSYIFSVLMINPDAPVNELMAKFLKMYYTTTHDIIFNYYDHLEQRALHAARGLQFYGGIKDAIDAYLEPEEFEEFFKTLNDRVHTTEGRERRLLNRLLTGLSFTRLELMRTSDKMYDKSLTAEPISTLRDHSAYDNMKNYREAYGDIDAYLHLWEKLDQLKPFATSNLLKNRKLYVYSDLDNDSDNPSDLTDGLVGFPTDYHTNWLIISKRVLDVEIPADLVKPGRKITVSTLHAPRWRIAAPKSIQLKVGGKVIASAPVEIPDIEPGTSARAMTSIVIPPAATSGKLHLCIEVSDNYPKFAVDEIILSNN